MEISLNWLAIALVTLMTWMGGALWFGPIFGKLWMKIHHGDKKMSDDEMKEAMKGMWKLLVTEFIASFLMVMTLSFLIKMLPSFSGIHLAFLVWIGFVMPAGASVVLWGNDQKKWMPTKILLIAGNRLIFFVLAGYILGIWP